MSFDFKRAIKFEHNVGDQEKKYRLYGGVALFVTSIFTASIALLVVGLVLIATGYSGWCPVYSGLQKNTCGSGAEAAAATAAETAASDQSASPEDGSTNS